jgi:hypothetical protein
VSAWRSRDLELRTWSKQHWVTEKDVISTNLVTSTETVWKPVPTQCDRLPRVTSTGNVTHISASTWTYWEPVFDSGPPATALPNQCFEPHPLFPVCEIRKEDCSAQWEYFQLAFRNSTLGFGQLTDGPDEGQSYMGCETTRCWKDVTWNIKRWMGYRKYAAVRNFFGSCQQPADACYNFLSDINDDHTSPELGPNCEIVTEWFVLIFFAPEDNVSRDLCSNQNWDESRYFMASNNSLVRTAILESIVFQSKEKVFGFQTIDLQFQDSKYSIGMLSLGGGGERN